MYINYFYSFVYKYYDRILFFGAQRCGILVLFPPGAQADCLPALDERIPAAFLSLQRGLPALQLTGESQPASGLN